MTARLRHARHGLDPLLVLFLLLAAFLRLWRPDVIEFKYDEVHPLLLARRILSGQLLLLGSGGSSGLPNPAGFSYLLALPEAICADARCALVLLGFLDALTVVPIYLAGRRLSDRTAALAAAGLYAVSPWVVFYARKLSVQAVPLVLALTFYALLLAVADRRPRALLAAGLGLGVLSQLHTLGFLVLPPALLALALLRPRLAPRYYLGAAAVWLILVLPYLARLAWRADAYFQALRERSLAPARWDAEALRFTVGLLSGHNVQSVLDVHAPWVWDLGRGLTAVHPLLWALLALGAFTALAGIARLPAPRAPAATDLRADPPEPATGVDLPVRRRGLVVLVLWTAMPLIVLSRHAIPLDYHHVQVATPGPFLLVGLGLAAVLRRLPRILRSLVLAGGSALLALMALQSVALVHQAALRAPLGGFGIPLREWRTLAQEAGRLAREEDAPLYVLTAGADPSFQERPAVLWYLLGRQTQPRFLDAGLGSFLVLRPDTGLVVVEAGVSRDTQQLLDRWTRQVWPPGAQPRWGQLSVRLAPPVVPAEIAHAPMAALANGVRLWAAEVGPVAAPGEAVTAILYWVVDPAGVPARQDYSVFNHLLGPDGERVSQADGLGLPSYAWRPGDLIAQAYRLPLPEGLPPGRYQLVSGMYSLGDFQRVPLLGDSGDAVTVATVRVERSSPPGGG